MHARLMSAQETERKRIARELHDGVGQILSGVKYSLEALPGKLKLRGRAAAKVLKVGASLEQAIAELRRVSQNLMPSELVDLGLIPALRALCREFGERSGIYVTVRSGPADVDPELALTLYRIAQEALHNIGKHSKASMAVVDVELGSGHIVLSVIDNGAGFKSGAPAAIRRGMGQESMSQRAASVGGVLSIHSAPGEGTTLSVRIPLIGRDGEDS